MTLHIVSKNNTLGYPIPEEVWHSIIINKCNALENEKNSVIFIGDGVYNLISDRFATKITSCSEVQIYAIQDDVTAKGIGKKLSRDVKLIDYLDFVGLVMEHDKSVSW